MSYSGSGDGTISLNAVTQPSSLPAFDDVASLISTFNNSVFFKNAYVPSISKGQNTDGSVTLSFLMNMDFQKPETGSDNLNVTVNNNSTDSSAKVAAPKIPVVNPTATNASTPNQ